MKKKAYKCPNCGEVTTFYKEGHPCPYCGNAEMKEWLPEENKTLSNEVELHRKEIMIAFKRLVDVELRVEAVENKLRG